MSLKRRRRDSRSTGFHREKHIEVTIVVDVTGRDSHAVTRRNHAGILGTSCMPLKQAIMREVATRAAPSKSATSTNRGA